MQQSIICKASLKMDDDYRTKCTSDLGCYGYEGLALFSALLVYELFFESLCAGKRYVEFQTPHLFNGSPSAKDVEEAAKRAVAVLEKNLSATVDCNEDRIVYAVEFH